MMEQSERSGLETMTIIFNRRLHALKNILISFINQLMMTFEFMLAQ